MDDSSQSGLLSISEQLALREAVAASVGSGRLIQTNWILITGAPGSGKTTLCNQLATTGWAINKDPGREVIENDIAAGKDAPRADYMAFQERVVNHMLSRMRELAPCASIFFDYGIAESLAFLKASALPWSETILQAAAQFAFRKIFLLEMVPLKNRSEEDEIRVEDPTRREQLQSLIRQIYVGLGQEVIGIPEGPVQQRLNAIAGHSGC